MAGEGPSGEVEHEEHKRNISNRLVNCERIPADLITKVLLPILFIAAPALFLHRIFDLDGSVLEMNPIQGLAELFIDLGLVLGCVSFIWIVMWILDSSVAFLRLGWNQTQLDGIVELDLQMRAVQLLETFNRRYLKVLLIMTSSLLCFLAGYICLGLPITKSLWYHQKVILIIVFLALLSLVVSISILLSRVSNEYFTDEIWCRDLKCTLQRKLNLKNGALVHE